MGMSGISVARFFEMDDTPDFISVTGLLVKDNRIRGCMRLEVGELPSGSGIRLDLAALRLADVERFILAR
jgi:hypothetical protein